MAESIANKILLGSFRTGNEAVSFGLATNRNQFQEKLRVLKEQAKHDRFGQQHKHLPQNIMNSGFYSKIFACMKNIWKNLRK